MRQRLFSFLTTGLLIVTITLASTVTVFGYGYGNVEVSAPTSENEEITENVFDDLGNVAWAEESITFLYERGIVDGKREGVFAPNDLVTRAELVKIIITAMDKTGIIGETSVDAESAKPADLNSFNDVSVTEWYAPYIASAKQRGIISGDEYGNFNPNAQISREDMATILHRTVGGGAAVNSSSFNDSGLISDYAKTAVDLFAEKDIINGFNGNFGPKDSATRAEMAVIMHRLMTIVI